MRALAGAIAVATAVAAVSSCGSPQRGAGDGAVTIVREPEATAAATPEAGGPFVPGGDVTPARVCARLATLRSMTSCDAATGYSLTEAECEDDWQKSLETRGADARRAAMKRGRCVLDHEACDEVSSCIDTINRYADEQDGTPTTLRACADTGVYAPVGMPRAQWEKRRGASAKRYSDVKTSKKKPIEVCGIPAQSEWLLDATCNDGSRPFADAAHAKASRVRNVGPGGRCGSIVDLYEVPCPERAYKIYIDAYVCPER